jgi:hypothetical protein
MQADAVAVAVMLTACVRKMVCFAPVMLIMGRAREDLVTRKAAVEEPPSQLVSVSEKL